MYRLVKAAVAGPGVLIVFAGAAFAALWMLLLRNQPMDMPSNGVVAWWTLLCAISVVNICGWHRSALALARRKNTTDPGLQTCQRWQLLLSAVFVLGCGFRSILPRADVQRLGLVDSWLSSVLVGRSVATLAELCFVTQWALLLRHIAKNLGCPFGSVASWLVVPFIAVAEVCSWSAVLTTCYAGNVIEESIWALSAALLLVSCLILWRRCPSEQRLLLAVALALGTGYLAFMCAVDIPMYVCRWLDDQASGREYLSIVQGLEDVWSRRVVSFAWEEWRTEMPWMSLYFSVGVWWSLALVHAPRLDPRRRMRMATIHR